MESLKRDLTTCTISASTVILDIEGTTTSISFVKDILFPYIRSNLEKFLTENWGSDKLQEHVKALRIQAQQDEENKVEGVILIPEEGEDDALKLALIDNIKWQMDNDRKTKSLKDLQGLIMEEGYKAGDLKGHVYDDVEQSLKSWSEQNKSIYIYSSGSIQAQKLLFGNTEKGDMLPLIKGHFDTNVGMKGDASSYKEILKQISISPSEAAFFTDVPTEARAAKEAGILAILVSREGNVPLSDQDKTEFQVITSFEDVEFEANCKKMKICPENLVTISNKEIENCSFSIEDREKPDPPIQNCIESEKCFNNEKMCDGFSNSDELMDVDDSSADKNSNCDTKNSDNIKQEDSSTESKKEESTEAMKVESSENKQEKSIEIKKEEATEIMKEDSNEVMKEESTQIKKEDSADCMKEKPIESKKEKPAEIKKEESIQSVKEESLQIKEELAEKMKQELAEGKKEGLNENIKQNPINNIQEELNEKNKEESFQSKMEVENKDKKEESTDSLKENTDEIKKESIKSMKEESMEVKEELAESKEEELPEGKKEEINESVKQNPTENMQEEESAEGLKEELVEGKKEELNENVKQNPTENIEEESDERKKEESTQNKMEVANENKKEELTDSVKEKSIEIQEESTESMKEKLAESKKEEPNEKIKQNPTDNMQEKSIENKMEVTNEYKKEESTESIKKETTGREDGAINTNNEMKNSNLEDAFACKNVIIKNDESVASIGTEKKHDANSISDIETNNLNENPSVTIDENKTVKNGESLQILNVENQDKNLTENDDKKQPSTNSKSDLSRNEEHVEFENKDNHVDIIEDNKHDENADDRKINANSHVTSDICEKKQSEEAVFKKPVMVESQKGDIATNGLEETNKIVSEICSGEENKSSPETNNEMLKSISENGSKTTNGFSTPDLIEDNGCTEKISSESKKCDSSESTSLESIVEA